MVVAMILLRRNAAYYIKHADVSRNRKDWVIAAASYAKALELDPGLGPIWVQRGHALKESGNLVEAELAYRRALAIDPDSADTNLQLAHVRKIQGDRAGAAEFYRAVLRHAPGHPDAILELDALGEPHDVRLTAAVVAAGE